MKKIFIAVLLTVGLLKAQNNNPNLNYEMIKVEEGTFMMGGTMSDEKPIHSVTLNTYKIGKSEVTQKLWKEVMGSNPSNFVSDELPVEKVSWDMVQVFISKLNQYTVR